VPYIQYLYQAQLIPAPPAAEFYRIHALTYKVQAQAPRPDIFESAPAHLFRIRRHTAIFQQDLKSIFGLVIPQHANPAERGLDGPLYVSEIGMANDIGQRFVDGENHGVAFRLGESQCGSELSQGVSHHA
jgi:hypothetical protein